MIEESESWSNGTRRRVLRSCVIYEAQRVKREGLDRVVIKLRAQCTPQAHDMQQIYPEAKLLFMYRLGSTIH